jgi:hypothetical protein
MGIKGKLRFLGGAFLLRILLELRGRDRRHTGAAWNISEDHMKIIGQNS